MSSSAQDEPSQADLLALMMKLSISDAPDSKVRYQQCLDRLIKLSSTSPASVALEATLIVPGPQTEIEVLNFLEAQKLIVCDHILFEDLPKRACTILLGNSEPGIKFTGRQAILDRVLTQSRSNFTNDCNKRTNLVMVTGPPGVGKSRTLIEAAIQLSQIVYEGHALILAGTFNNSHNPTELDIELFKLLMATIPVATDPSATVASESVATIPSETGVWLILRLLHSYANPRGSDDSYESWCCRLKILFHSNSIQISVLQYLTVGGILSYLRRRFNVPSKFPIICLFDEVLKPWNIGELNWNLTWSMMRAFYNSQGAENCMSVIFSTLSVTDLPSDVLQTTSLSERYLHAVPLSMLENSDATSILESWADQPRNKIFIEKFHLTKDEFVARTIACIGTLPRALSIALLEFQIYADNLFRSCSFQTVLDSVTASISARYPIPKELTDQAFMEVALGLPASDVDLARILERRGGISTFDKSTKIMEMNSVHLMSFARQLSEPENRKERDAVLVSALTSITRSHHTSFNIFEEIHRNHLLLRLHYLHKFKRYEVLTVADVFQGVNIFMEPSHSSVTAALDFAIPVNSVIHVFDEIPTYKRFLESNPSIHMLCMPRSTRFPAIDLLLFIRTTNRGLRGNGEAWLVVGIQDKFSASDEVPMPVSEIKKAQGTFRAMMQHSGWPAESILFVAALRQNAPAYFSTGGPDYDQFCAEASNMIIMDNSKCQPNASSILKQHLGASIFNLTAQLHGAPHSDSYRDIKFALLTSESPENLLTTPFHEYQMSCDLANAACGVAQGLVAPIRNILLKCADADWKDDHVAILASHEQSIRAQISSLITSVRASREKSIDLAHVITALECIKAEAEIFGKDQHIMFETELCSVIPPISSAVCAIDEIIKKCVCCTVTPSYVKVTWMKNHEEFVIF